MAKFNLCFLIIVGNFVFEYTKADITNLIFNNLYNNILNRPRSVSNASVISSNADCVSQLRIWQKGLQNLELWALQISDAWAKVPSGILYGHTMEMGNFDECLNIKELIEDDNYIQGKYCLAHINMPKTEGGDNSISNLDLGICIPRVCSAEEAETLLKQTFSKVWGLTIENNIVSLDERRCTSKNSIQLKPLDWVAICILILLVILMLLSTIYDYYATIKQMKLNPLLSAFSVRSNMCQLLHLTSAADTPRHIIPSLNGIRSLSIIWIIFLHTYMMLILSPNVNKMDIKAWNQTWFFMIWKNGNYAVDTFFFLSGLLLISVAFREMEKNSGKLNVPLMYLHRYIRLTPVLYLAVLLFMTLFPLLGNGPIWNDFTSSYRLCEETWWATLLYVQNYAAAGKMCLGHSWYLAVDTQLYVLSPLVLILIWKWRRWGLAALLFIGLLFVVCLFTIVMYNELVVFEAASDPGADSSAQRQTYYSTHTRTSPWIIGILFGYYLHSRNGRRLVLPKTVVLGGWVLSIALFMTVIFSLYPKTQPGASTITPLEGAFYLALSRVAWPLGLCWLVFACVNGYAGPVNQFLSCSLWQPIAKLSYCMYIWHFLVVTLNAGQIKINSHFSNYDGILRFWSDFGITMLVSTIMYLAIEAPMLGIEKFMMSSKKPKTEVPAKQTPPTISLQHLCD